MNQKYYLINPEVAGQLGDNSILDYSTKPPVIIKLHYQFDGWLGDDLLAGFGCFICTEALMEYFIKEKLTGFTSEPCEISKSEFFIDFHPELQLPKFHWLKIGGNFGDDFFIKPNNWLIISENVMGLLKKFKADYCDVEDFN